MCRKISDFQAANNKKCRQLLSQQYFIFTEIYDAVLFVVQKVWALGSLFEILMAYLIIPQVGWRILVLVSALPMVLAFLSSMVCC